MRIILARHGETEWNVAEIFRGRIDVELSEKGLKQAELLAGYLRDFKIEAIYSSALKRALRTAQAISQYHRLNVEISTGLMDLDFGEWEGLSRREVQEKYKESYSEWLNYPEKTRMPKGESLNDVRERAIALIGEVTVKHEGTVVLVSHRVVTKILICALLGLDNSHFWNIEHDTCGMTTFNYRDGQFILTEHNNTSCLKPIQDKRLSDF